MLARREKRATTEDPVCGMDVDERKSAATLQYQGTTYYFCSAGCKAAFDKQSERYADR